MAREFAYLLNTSPEAKSDGSGDTKIAMRVGYRDVTEDPWTDLGWLSEAPLAHASIRAVLDMPNTPGKIVALRNVLQASAKRTSEPLTREWTKKGAEDWLDANELAAQNAVDLDAYLSSEFGYPAEIEL